MDGNKGILTETHKTAFNRLSVITAKQGVFLGKEAGVDRHRGHGFRAT